MILYNTSLATDDTRVAVVLFGSEANVAGNLGRAKEIGWSSSAAYAVEEFVMSQGKLNRSQWDDEALAVEALRIAERQGSWDDDRAHQGRPWTRGFTLGRLDRAEWLAEIYYDVVLDKDRWVPGNIGVDRIVIGAPFWVRIDSNMI